MKIVSNPGLNLGGPEIARYDIALLPQRIMVDGVEHDTRSAIPFADLDRWMRRAKDAPYVVGTTAAEFLDIFRRSVETDAELLVVTASKKLIASYQGAVSAERTLKALPGFARARVVVIDSESADLGAGLPVFFAGEAIRAGHSIDRVAFLARSFAEGGRSVMVPRVLDNMVRGGRATFLRAAVANFLNVSPVVCLEDGELVLKGVTKRTEIAAKILEVIIAKVGQGRRVWAGVAHGGNADEAVALAAEVGKVFAVDFLVVRPLCASSYLHLGKDALAVFVGPIDKLSWSPPTPEPL